MRDGDLDIVELILSRIPEDTEIQQRIKFYIQTHKTNCNNFIYVKYEKEATYFNAILKALMSDLSAEVVRTMAEKYEI